MQEIVLILSSLAGVATAAAVRKMPRDKNQLLSLGASSHIKSQISSLKIEKDILTKTISRLYQAESEFSKIQKDKLLLKYQHQLGIVLAKLEKLEQASHHPDLGPVGDGLITLMDQKLSKLDDRLYELSSKMVSSKVETPKAKVPEVKQETKQKISNVFNFDKPKESKMDPIVIPPTKSKQSFELTTLTNISRGEPKFPLFENEPKQVVKPMPQPRVVPTEVIKPKDEIVQEIIQPKPKVEDKIEIIQSVVQKPEINLEVKPDLNKEVAKITEHKALPEPIKSKPVTLDDDFDDDTDDLDKIKGDIMRVLSKLDQAEVE
jgi:myosin heavy subunit